MTERADLPTALLDAAMDLVSHGERGGMLPVSGDSMLPNLRPGYRVAVDLHRKVPSPGSIVVFRQDDYMVVHRFVWNSTFPDGRPSYRMRGDGRVGLDPHVAHDKVLGVVVAFHDGNDWWDLERPGARLWARLTAWHDAFWTCAGWVSERFGPVGRVLRLRDIVWLLDRTKLRIGHALFFKILHRKIAPPEFLTADAPAP